MTAAGHVPLRAGAVPTAAARYADTVQIGNRCGEVQVASRPFADVQPGVVIVEGIWPNTAFGGGLGVNQLFGSDRVPSNGGSAFHDTAVWLRAA